MSIVAEVNRLKDAKTAIKTAIEGKGVTVPEATMLDGMASLIESIEAGGDISPWRDVVTFSITPSEDLTGSINFTSFIPGRTAIPAIFVLGQRASTSNSSYVMSMAFVSTWNSWKRLYYEHSTSTSNYPQLQMTNGQFKINIGSYKLEAGVPYWGVMLWK